MPDPRPRLCILGSVNMDLSIRAPRLPAPGETILGGPFAAAPGGKGANQAVAAARMSAAASLIARVGDDAHGRTLLAALRDNGVDLTACASLTGAPTGLGLITIADDGQNTIVVAPGANAHLTPDDIDAARPVIAGADVLLMQLEVPLPAAARAAQIARDCGVAVILNAAPAAQLPGGLLSNTDILVVNQTEAAALAALPAGASPESILARLASLGPPTVVMTLGAHGALHSRPPSPPRHTAAFPVICIDAVGAGDAFCSALAVRWAAHRIGGSEPDDLTLMDVMSWACAAGALATTRRGAIPSLPTRREVTALLKGQAPVADGLMSKPAPASPAPG